VGGYCACPLGGYCPFTLEAGAALARLGLGLFSRDIGYTEEPVAG
jgi:hypothetical protein